ncbi:MAG: hypothetical protein ABL916_15585 [Burkholderiaceae bacterium]
MVNDFPFQYRLIEAERNAYNAAFHELGFRWHWDAGTYSQLTRSGLNAEQQLRHYIETQQAHLLKAYDTDFLVGVIQEKQAVHRQRTAASAARPGRHFDWAQTLGGELGA